MDSLNIKKKDTVYISAGDLNINIKNNDKVTNSYMNVPYESGYENTREKIDLSYTLIIIFGPTINNRLVLSIVQRYITTEDESEKEIIDFMKLRSLAK